MTDRSQPTVSVPAKLFDRIIGALAAATYPHNPDHQDRDNAHNLWTALLALRFDTNPNPPTQTIDREARFCALVDNLAKPERIILSEHIQHIYRSGIAEERERCAVIARAWKLDPLLDDEGNMGDLADAIAIEETDRAK